MLHPIIKPLWRPLVSLSVALVVAACGSSNSSPGGGTAVAGGGGDMQVSIDTPANGATVSLPFDVQLASNVPIGPPETGNHHFHLYYDTDTTSADYDIVYGTTWHVTRQLSPGTHRIIAALANPDHSLAGASTTIMVTVGGGSGASPAASGSAPAASGAVPPPAGTPSSGGPYNY